MTSQPDYAIEAYYALHPTNFAFLENFHVRQTIPTELKNYELSVTIELRHKNNEDVRRLLLSFQGVRNLLLTPPLRMVIQISQLEITPIHSNGWEGINYSVKEVENETLAFLCETFTATIQDK